MTSHGMLARLLAALAMPSIGPAVLFIEAELASRQVRSGLLDQERSLEELMAAIRMRPIVWERKHPWLSGVTCEEAHRLYQRVLDTTREVNWAFTSDTLFWMFDERLPFTAGLNSVYEASGPVQDYVAALIWRVGVCRVAERDDEAPREEERRIELWMERRRAELRELSARLTEARAAYERDRPKLTILAWSLGFVQLVGWGLLVCVVLPQDYRKWRERRALRKSAASDSNQTNRR